MSWFFGQAKDMGQPKHVLMTGFECGQDKFLGMILGLIESCLKGVWKYGDWFGDRVCFGSLRVQMLGLQRMYFDQMEFCGLSDLSSSRMISEVSLFKTLRCVARLA